MSNVVKWFTTTKLGRCTGVFLLSGTIGLAAYLQLPGTEYLQNVLDLLKATGAVAGI